MSNILKRKQSSLEEDKDQTPKTAFDKVLQKTPTLDVARVTVYDRPRTLRHRVQVLNTTGLPSQSPDPLGRPKPWNYPRKRPEWSYSKNEWLENKDVPRYINMLVNKGRVYQSNVCLDNLVYGVNPRSDKTLSIAEVDEIFLTLHELPTDQVFKVVDIDQKPLVIYLPDILSRVWQNAPDHERCNADTLNSIIRNALDTLAADFPPSNKASETRYSHQADEKDQYAAYGTYHFAVWQPTGHHHSDHVFHYQDDKGASEKQMNAATVFLQTISPLIQSIGIVFEGVDKSTYQSYLRIFDHYLDKAPMDYLQTSQRACFMVIAVLRNNRVHPHKDSDDYPDGWAVMTCVGSFEGGDLCLPGLNVNVSDGVWGGVRIGYKPGDVVFIRASVVEHFISRFTGEDRSSFVFFTKATS